MVGANLVLHRGARHVELEELEKVPCPPSTDTWFPTPHIVVLKKVLETLDGAGFAVEKTELALARDDARFFGTLTLKSRVTDAAALAVGIRNSNDKSFPIGFCVGDRVFTCDNLAFHSEIIITRRHTRFGETRYGEAISQAILGLHQYQLAAAQRISALQNFHLSEHESNSLLLQAFEYGLLSTRTLPLALKEWRAPSFAEHRERNSYNLLQAITFALRDRAKSSPQEFCAMTIGLHKLLAPPERETNGYENQNATAV